MSPNESRDHKVKNNKSSAELTEAILSAEKSKAKNPPGLSMPPEKEMSPPQLG